MSAQTVESAVPAEESADTADATTESEARKSFRFTVPIADLRAALPTLRQVASAHSTLPILATIHIERVDGQTRFSATDLDRRLSYTTGTAEPVPASELGRKLLQARRQRENGAICVPLSTLNAAAKAGDRTGDLVFTGKGFTYPFDLKPIEVKDYLPAEEFPPIKHPPNHDWRPLSDAARNGMLEALPSASTDESRYILLSVCLEKNRLIATDGRHALVITTPLPDGVENWIVPSAAVKALAGSPAKHPWEVAEGERTADSEQKEKQAPASSLGPLVSVFFRCGPWELHTKLIEGNYPNINQVIPPDDKKQVVLRLTLAQRKEILSLLKRQPPSASDQTDSALCTVQNGLLTFKGHDGWSFQVKLDKNHPHRFVKAQRRFWIRAFTLCHEIRILDEMSPVHARNTIGPAKITFVFMPVRVKA